MRHLVAGQCLPVGSFSLATGGSLYLIFTVRDQGSFDLIRSTKIVLLTPHTWGVWQLVIYNQAKDQIVAGGHISIELIIVLCVASLTLFFYNCCALFCDVFAHTNTTHTHTHTHRALPDDGVLIRLSTARPPLIYIFCQFAFHKMLQEMKRREADYALFSHFLCFTDCQLSISSVTDKLVSLVPIRSNCQCGCCLLPFELPSRLKRAVRIVFVPPEKPTSISLSGGGRDFVCIW